MPGTLGMPPALGISLAPALTIPKAAERLASAPEGFDGVGMLLLLT
eukprot:CAMPEP_0175782844 /NCGR_PEP_ID=MMETSP0097-20121207/77996_1 /TAXON_ID=311494 /ORGANISM="Alexandrium monilatum, Strain CCMP3105" /LENGTH=45 /DNA_ID= /DNA_START= /DNA_END= /DNA_ORIENTATION=